VSVPSIATFAPGPGDIDPLAAPSLRHRFPHLEEALDRELMCAELQHLLLNDGGLTANSCGRPRAHLAEGACRLQYPLRVHDSSGQGRELLVLGTMFSEEEAATRFERESLAPLVARMAPDGPQPKPTGVLEALGLAVGVFPVDARLPTLIDVTNGPQMAHVLRSLLDRDVAVEAIELARMGRTSGCVLRYRLADGAVIFGKVGSAGAIDDVRAVLDALARGPGPRAVLFPRLLGHSAEHDLLLLSAVPGRRSELRSDSAAGTVVGRAAIAAAAIHASDVVVGGIRTIESEIDRTRRAVSLIDDDAPALAAWLTSVIDTVESRASQLPAQAVTLGHGDFTPSQLLVDGGRIGVLDFDKVCQAEPALDLGRFLAYLRVTLAKSGLSPSPTIASSLLAAYEGAGGPPTLEARVELYGLLSLVGTAVQGWQRLKASRVQLAFQVLARQLLMGGAPSRRGGARAWPSSLPGGKDGPSSTRGAHI